MDFSSLAGRPDPIPWADGHKIPWGDASFSERMLREHLNQNHDRASRSLPKVVDQVDYLCAEVAPERGRVLDLGCGPGLYCLEFAQRGFECTGIDISPASIAYAQRSDSSSVYRLEDVTTADFGEGYKLAMMLFGEFQSFEPSVAAHLLARMKRSVVPGGAVVLEVLSQDKIASLGKQAPSWRAMSSGLFGDTSHLLLQEHFWFPSDQVAIGRHYVIGEGGEVSEYRDTLKGYSDQEYIQMFHELGLQRVMHRPSLRDDAGASFVIGFC